MIVHVALLCGCCPAPITFESIAIMAACLPLLAHLPACLLPCCLAGPQEPPESVTMIQPPADHALGKAHLVSPLGASCRLHSWAGSCMAGGLF